MDDDELRFIKGLTKLSKDTGIVVSGCGCCGSPYLVRTEGSVENSGYSYIDSLQWIEEADEWSWSKYSKDIIKEDS